jgi:hypothetical protein
VDDVQGVVGIYVDAVVRLSRSEYLSEVKLVVVAANVCLAERRTLLE